MMAARRGIIILIAGSWTWKERSTAAAAAAVVEAIGADSCSSSCGNSNGPRSEGR